MWNFFPQTPGKGGSQNAESDPPSTDLNHDQTSEVIHFLVDEWFILLAVCLCSWSAWNVSDVCTPVFRASFVLSAWNRTTLLRSFSNTMSCFMTLEIFLLTWPPLGELWHKKKWNCCMWFAMCHWQSLTLSVFSFRTKGRPFNAAARGSGPARFP